MSEPLADTPRPAEAAGEVAVVYAGDYVNKMGGQRIEHECLTRIERGCRGLVINFRDTELVNSIGVSILLGVIDEAGRRGARVAFASVSPHTLKLFELLGLTRLVLLADCEEDALATLEEFSATPPGH
jgi:stage II sporulation protein AA (anti-sigma F factor antagonist)